MSLTSGKREGREGGRKGKGGREGGREERDEERVELRELFDNFNKYFQVVWYTVVGDNDVW